MRILLNNKEFFHFNYCRTGPQTSQFHGRGTLPFDSYEQTSKPGICQPLRHDNAENRDIEVFSPNKGNKISADRITKSYQNDYLILQDEPSQTFAETFGVQEIDPRTGELCYMNHNRIEQKHSFFKHLIEDEYKKLKEEKDFEHEIDR